MAGLVDSPTGKAPIGLPPRLLIAVLFLFANNLRAEDVLLSVNVKKPVAVTSDKFLSYTLDPTVVLTSNAIGENIERSINMAKALAPAYVRIGGLQNRNSFIVEGSLRQDSNLTFNESDWTIVQRWAENAGLDVVACIAPLHSDIGGRDLGWDSRNAMNLISFSDYMGFNASWQLGYGNQKRRDASGSDVGKDVIRLRTMLDAFPRYSNGVVTGPDVVTCRSKQQQQYFQDFLNVAGTALSAITWRPKLASITLESEGVSLHNDNLALDREILYKVGGRIMAKKPLWLAESRPEACKNQFLGALVWTRRLGNAAKLGIQVIMRQPNDGNFIQPTPDYWVSVLHKSLVGREVLDAKIATGNRTHVYFYCQCTKPSSKYEKGSLTIFGINLMPFRISANIKGIKIKTAHSYILLPGFDAENRMFSETVLLNNEPLHLLKDGEIPEMKPTILSNPKGVDLKLPSGGIGFWVLPDLKIKSCGGFEEDINEKISQRKPTKHSEETDSEEAAVYNEARELAENQEDERSGSRNRKRRKYRYNNEDDGEQRYRRFEARMDLEKLENLLQRRNTNDEKKRPKGRTVYIGFDEKNREKLDNEREETVEEIKAKLKEYKNRLKQYESRNKTISKSKDSVVEAQENDTIDSEKVVEAMMLISKMEKAMKNFEKIEDDSGSLKLESNHFRDAMANHVGSTTSKNSEDTFLDELLKSKKIMRASVPSKIEDQLRGIYEMLAEEKARRRNNSSIVLKLADESNQGVALRETEENKGRARRQIDKKSIEDLSGLRKEGLYRRRWKIEDAKERRMERRRKNNKDGQSFTLNFKPFYETKENNFHGFKEREPLKDFPEGDLFLTTGTSDEANSNDYDYVTDDDDRQAPVRSSSLSGTYETSRNQPELDDTAWIEEGDNMFSHMPKELFENAKITGPHLRDDLDKVYELWEPESMGNQWNSQDLSKSDNPREVTIDQIVQERQPDAHFDEMTKEAAVKRLNDYSRILMDPRLYDEDDGIDYMDTKSSDESQDYVSRQPINSVALDVTKNPEPIESLHGNPAMAKDDKSNEDLEAIESETVLEYDSPDLSITTMSSTGPRTEDVQESECPEGHPSSKAKRSIVDAERFLDHKVAFRDGDDSKDRDRRVVRADRADRRREDRKNRRILKNEGSPRKNRSARLDKNHRRGKRSTRRARMTSREAVEYYTNKYVAEVKEAELAEPSGDAATGEDETGTKEDSPSHLANLNGERNFAPTENRQLVQRQRNSADEKVDSSLEKKPLDFDTDNTVEKKNRDNAEAKSFQAAPKPSEDVESANTEISSAPQMKGVQTSPKRLDDHRISSSRLRTRSKSVDKSTRTNLKNSGINVTEPDVHLRNSSVPTSSADELDRVENGPTGHKNMEDPIVGLVKDSSEDSKDSKTKINVEEKSITKRLAKSKTKGNVTDRTHKGRKSLSPSKDVVKLDKPMKEDAKTSRKSSQRTKQATKILDSAIVRAARIDAKSEAPKRADVTKKPTKPLHVVTKTPTNEQSKAQKKRAERIEKLQDKLRHQKAKMAEEHQRDLIDDLVDPRDVKETNLRKRDIVDQIGNDGDGGDIVDEEELDYSMPNKLINYDNVEDDYCVVDSEATTEYDPEIVEVVKRPLQRVREKNVIRQGQPIRTFSDPILGGHSGPEGSTIVDIANNLHDGMDTIDREAKEPAGEYYYSIYESLENPGIYRYPSKEKSGEEKFDEDFWPVELNIEGSILRRVEDRESEEYTKVKYTTQPILKEDVEAEEGDGFPGDYEIRSAILNSREKNIEEGLDNSDNLSRFRRYVTNRKNQYMKKNQNLKGDGGQNQDQHLKVVQENDYRMSELTQNDGNSDDERNYVPKKKYKNLGYEKSKSKYPKYARLAAEKIKSDQRRRSNDPRKNMDGSEVGTLDRDQLMKKTDLGDSRRKKTKSNSKHGLWPKKAKKVDSAQLESKLEATDDLDLAEALHSSKVELSMMTAAKDQKRNRRKRHLPNGIFRYDVDSAINEIPLDLIGPPNKDASGKMIFERFTVADAAHWKDSDRAKTVWQDSIDNIKNADYSDSDSTIVPIVPIVKKSNPSIEQDGSPHKLSSFVRVISPGSEATLIDDSSQNPRLREFFPKFIDVVDGKIDREQIKFYSNENPISTESPKPKNESSMISNIFSSAITRIKIFFNNLFGFVRTIRFN